jgi:RNase P/RNase MRP subunit p30
MRTYDLDVRLALRGGDLDSKGLTELANELGFAGFAIDSNSQSITRELNDLTFEIYSRMTLTPRSAARLRSYVTKQQDKADLLVLHGRTKPIALAAAEIGAIDMVMLQNLDDFALVDSQIARALANQDKPIEVCLQGLLTHQGPARSRLMRVMNTAMEYLIRAECNLILTSGATDIWRLRAPRDLASLGYLASIPETIANNAIIQNPIRLIKKIQASKNSSSSNPSRRL